MAEKKRKEGSKSHTLVTVVLSRGETAVTAPSTRRKARHGTELPNGGRPRDLVHLPNAGMASISSQPSSGQTRPHRLPDSHTQYKCTQTRYRRDGTRSTSRGRANGLSNGAMAGG